MPSLLKPPADTAAILIYDIETTPIRGRAWVHYDAHLVHVDEPSKLMCFAYKWFGQSRKQFIAMWDEGDPDDDRNVAEALHSLFDRADITIAYNGDRFDRKKANTRFLKHGLGPVSPAQTVDPLKIIKREFSHGKNTLDYITQYHDLRAKRDAGGISLWVDCENGDETARRQMKRYNLADVDALEDVYLLVRSWTMPNSIAHPNLAHWSKAGEICCRVCGSDDYQKRGKRYKKVGVKQLIQCNDCGAYSEHRFNKRQHLGGVQTV